MRGSEILVVDGDSGVRFTLSVSLGRNGYAVRTAKSAKEALILLRSWVPDLVVLDPAMTVDIEGFGLACMLRDSPKFANMPVIMVTSYPDKIRSAGPSWFQKVLGEKWRTDCLFEKPVDSKKLLDKIRSILGRGKALENAHFYEDVEEEMVKEQSRFMMRVAHNLRAPLAATISILDVVLGEYLGGLNDQQVSYLRRIESPVRTMLSMINDLMVLYAQRRDKRHAVHKIAKIGAIIEKVQKTFQTQAEEKGLGFQVAVSNTLPAIKCDEEMIERMLENLVSNAIKYTPPGGRVTLVCDCDNDGSVRIQVSDTGIGIPKSDMARLFDEFFRAQNARDFEKVGTGLGLSIVKEIVDQHGGTIQVGSEEGLGTIFIVHFPPDAQDERSKNATGKPADASQNLIDEAVIRQYLNAVKGSGADWAREIMAKALELGDRDEGRHNPLE